MAKGKLQRREKVVDKKTCAKCECAIKNIQVIKSGKKQMKKQ